MKFNNGDKVEVNGNKQARIIGEYIPGMYEVRLWSERRHVGDIVVNENEIRAVE